jgi:hypothetical protein
MKRVNGREINKFKQTGGEQNNSGRQKRIPVAEET